MRSVWSEQATISTWLKVEQALARCQADHGVISEAAASDIEAIAASDLDVGALATEMALVGRPIVGLVKQLRALVGDQGSHVHHKATTQDIMDTAMAMQMKLGLEEIMASAERLAALLDTHIETQTSTMIMGRTNGQHAVPMRLATKLSVWRSELARRIEAISQAAQRGLNVQIGGPVGDLRGYENGLGEKVKSAIAAKLGLGVVEPHWQNARDGVVDIVGSLGALCATLCKIAHNVNLLSSSDIGEVSETHADGQGASSSMSHKRNQRSSEFAEAVARLGRQRAEQIGELALHEHERSGGVWIAEWIVVPEVFLFTSGALKWSECLFGRMEFHLSELQCSHPSSD